MTPQDLLKHYEHALSSQDWHQVAPLMHQDVCVTFSNGTFKGIEEVQAIFEQNFTSIKDEKYVISNLHWAYSSASYAVCLYEFHWQGTIDDELCSGGGRGTSVLVYYEDKWQIISEHLGPFSS